jgi:hypothetical protein
MVSPTVCDGVGDARHGRRPWEGRRGTLTGIHMVSSLGLGRKSQATKGNR